MAQLNPSNIQNGNIIQANDVLQLYNALTSGGGYNVSISGSLTGSATTSTTSITSSTTLYSNVIYYDLVNNGTTNFRPITGISDPLSAGSVTLDISDLLPLPTQLGVDIFITASPSGSCINPIIVDYSEGDLIFTTQDGDSIAQVLFTGWVI